MIHKNNGFYESNNEQVNTKGEGGCTEANGQLKANEKVLRADAKYYLGFK